MKLQRKPQRWLCAATAFAMALDMPVDEVLARVGHDGSEIVYPDLPEPMCRRGVHRQELIDIVMAQGYAVTPIELIPHFAPTYGQSKRVQVDYGGMLGNFARFRNHVDRTRGVIECNVNVEGAPPFIFKQHMVAYDHGKVFDPDTTEFDFDFSRCERFGFVPHTLWRFDRISHVQPNTEPRGD